MSISIRTALFLCALFAANVARGETAEAPKRYQASLIREFAAPEADQGVAVDSRHFYAIDNYIIAKYDKRGGQLVARWEGPEALYIRHLNSCYEDAGNLWCANSNYPQTPMASSVEVFSTTDMQHRETHSLGLMEEGSLTWFVPHAQGWIASFAHYDNKGSVGFKNHRYSAIIAFDKQWRRMGGWILPGSVLQRMAPYASSGGALGPDRLLYLSGHDRPELYVLARPKMGPTLIHVATIDTGINGQAFSWDPTEERVIYGVDRRGDKVKKIRVPEIDFHYHPYARPF